jgi:hypothetical protein
MATVNEPLGCLRPVSTTEDRTLYAYRPKRRTIRGLIWMTLSLLLVALAMLVALRVGQWYGWMTGIPPLLLATAAGYCGMLDLLNRPLFHLEVDRRARTLALMMPKEQGHALAKVKFSDVSVVEVKEKGPSTMWNVTLVLKGGRRIGLGLSDEKARSDELAAQFSELIGVEIVRVA